MEKLKQINFKKNPYRGILKEVAKEENVTPQAIWDAINNQQNPRIITIITQKIKKRTEIVNNAIKNFNEIIL